MAVLDFLSGLVEPVTNLIDDMHTSDEERLKVKAKLFEMESAIAAQVLDYETRLAEAKTKVITAEAQGGSWIQRSWRPIAMLTFLVLIVADTFGLTEFRLAGGAWDMLQLGLGGYVAGRSVEKVMSSVTKIMRKN